MQTVADADLDRIIDTALAEDDVRNDITSRALIPPNLEGRASVLVKKRGVLAGVEVARQVFLRIDPTLDFQILVADGAKVKSGDIPATISGRVISILQGERVALNFMQRLSGIASLTARYVARSRGYAAAIVDTRKTTPGLRLLEKYAVRMGGGKNHRLSLGDGVLVKDNHIAALRGLGVTLKDIVVTAKRNAPQGKIVEIEVTSIQEALEAVEAGADMILLDNMDPDEMRRVVGLVRGKARTEASGGITLANVREAAASGVDIISIGALTHSPKALDISIEVNPGSLRLVQG